MSGTRLTEAIEVRAAEIALGARPTGGEWTGWHLWPADPYWDGCYDSYQERWSGWLAAEIALGKESA